MWLQSKRFIVPAILAATLVLLPAASGNVFAGPSGGGDHGGGHGGGKGDGADGGHGGGGHGGGQNILRINNGLGGNNRDLGYKTRWGRTTPAEAWLAQWAVWRARA